MEAEIPKQEPQVCEMTVGLTEDFQKPKSAMYHARTYFAEFLGTMLLVLFGDGTCAQVLLNKAAVGSQFLSVNLGFAFGLTCALFVAGPISGGHLNPAITIAMALFGKFELRKVPGYIFAQFLGAFVASALIYLVYWPAIVKFDGGVRQVTGRFATAGIFATYPNEAAPIWNSLLVEIAITAVFLLLICAMTDPRHKFSSASSFMGIGLAIGVIGLSVGAMTGYSMNPARDFGPRFFTSIAGWGWKVFTARGYYFWVPIVGPIIGAIIGVGSYELFIYPN